MIFLKILFVIVIVFVILFVLSLIIYFFNLDMKAAALIMPVFEKHYDRVDRKKERQKAKEQQKDGEEQKVNEQRKNGERHEDASI